jgi:hypothetical protein
MAVFQIAVRPGLAHQELQVPIGDRVYTFSLRWTVREQRWYLDVYDEQHSPIYTGIAIVLNFPLGARCVSADFWPGVLLAVDTSNDNAEPGLDDLGSRVVLLYNDLEAE